MKRVLCLLLILTFIICGCGKSKSEVKVKLKADPLSGYVWSYDIADLEIAKVEEESDVKCDKTTDECSGNQIFIIKPLSEGKTAIRFNYKNDSDQTKYYVVYDVEIDKDLHIKETHQGTYE